MVKPGEAESNILQASMRFRQCLYSMETYKLDMKLKIVVVMPRYTRKTTSMYWRQIEIYDCLCQVLIGKNFVTICTWNLYNQNILNYMLVVLNISSKDKHFRDNEFNPCMCKSLWCFRLCLGCRSETCTLIQVIMLQFLENRWIIHSHSVSKST